MFSRSKTSTGLDVGQHMVRWAAVDTAAGRVKELWSAELVPARQQKHDLLEADALAKRMKELIAQCQKQVSSWSKSVYTSVQGPGTICAYLELPKLNDKELKTALSSKLTKQLPFPIDDVFLTHIVVPPLVDDGSKSAVVYVAVQKKVVEQRATLFRSLGLEVRGLETPAIALSRAHGRNHATSAELTALVQFGYQYTQVVITRQGVPYYHRQFPSAGGDATYAFQMGAQSDWKTAEDFKRSYDVSQKQVSIEPFLTKWMGEIKRTLDSFTIRQGQGVKIASMLLLGAGAHWPGLAPRLSEVVQMPVAVESWDKLKVDAAAQKAGDAAGFSLAVGLALAV